MKILDRESLLKKEELEVKKVDLGKGEFVYVKQMTGRERDTFERSLLREVKKGNESDYVRALEDFRAKLAVNTLCDKDGNLLLRANDYPVLSKNMSAARLERIVNIAQEMNKITEEDKEALVKNSKGVQNANSTSGSVKN